MGLVNRFTSGLVVPLSLSACAPKHDLETNLASNTDLITDEVRSEVQRLQDNADEQNIRLESLIRAIYALINSEANMAEFMDRNLVETVNPCKQDDIVMKNLVDDIVGSNNPWETKRILLENLAKQPALIHAFKKTNLYAELVHKYSSFRCKEPFISFTVTREARLIAVLKFCDEVVEKDITNLNLSSNLDWLRDYDRGTCDDKVIVFPNNEFNSIQVQKHERDLYTVVGPSGISLEGDLTVLIPEMSRQKQNIANSTQAVIDLRFYEFNYLNPSTSRFMNKDKKTVNAQINHVIEVFDRHFEESLIVHNYKDDSFRIIIGDNVIKVDVALESNAENSYFTYNPVVLDCSAGADCEEVKQGIDLNIYSQSGQNFLNLNELIWWLDTNHVYSYAR